MTFAVILEKLKLILSKCKGEQIDDTCNNRKHI